VAGSGGLSIVGKRSREECSLIRHMALCSAGGLGKPPSLGPLPWPLLRSRSGACLSPVALCSAGGLASPLPWALLCSRSGACLSPVALCSAGGLASPLPWALLCSRSGACLSPVALCSAGGLASPLPWPLLCSRSGACLSPVALCSAGGLGKPPSLAPFLGLCFVQGESSSFQRFDWTGNFHPKSLVSTTKDG